MPDQSKVDEFWRRVLTGEANWGLDGARRFFSRLPAAPRCKLCFAPFRLPGSGLVRLLGFRRSILNPQMCTICIRGLEKKFGGAEVPVSTLFADVRGSTTLAERIPAAEYAALLNRFYETVSREVDHHHGVIDKLIGDGVMALFIPGFVGPDHGLRAIETGQELLARAWDAERGEAWIPVGIGVHTGVAYVGVVGAGEVLDFTAVGDATNVAARLGSAAAAGELLVSEETARLAGLEVSGAERRHLDLKGRAQALDVLVFRREVEAVA